MDSVKPPAHQAFDRLRSQRRDCQSLLRLVHSCHETRGTDAESTGLEERAARPGEAIHSADTVAHLLYLTGAGQRRTLDREDEPSRLPRQR